MDYKAKFATEGAYAPDGLIAGNAHLLVARKVTVKSGQNLVRGAVIGKDDDGKYLLSLSAALDGSQTPDLIMAEACDATAADTQALAYERGDFNANALTLGTAHTVASIRDGLRAKGITILPAMAA
ncbi:head decoration protein [Thauera chlorobenzoica]|uniref:Putative phage protein n=1 Tax=Thauera chlorobenzoica TaxID=96773 RepID=A0A1H5Z7B1_9RHOO|nr:head decoration protein [Thauera chlorobenzoica]APR05646.1 Putative phage protein [Thauera chlorobenzoica]SEG31565.1 Bacteriophage lambda head decoration protein D [Thauera chlorobenzoica]